MFGINSSNLNTNHQSLISGMGLVKTIIIPSDYIEQESDGGTVDNRNSSIAPHNKIP